MSRPPHISAEDSSLRRRVALAYRSTREAGGSHDDAMGFAMVAYYEERPEAYADRVAASHQVAVFISSAINAGPASFCATLERAITDGPARQAEAGKSAAES